MAGQDEVIVFLSLGASYGVPGAAVARIETHGSILFLVDNRAYKLKRPVAFSLLDYSTLERREAACRAELRLNRRTAPDLYLGLHAVRRRLGGELGLDGEGAVVDWVVAMRRFDQADLFDHRAEAGQLGTERIIALADEIAAFHAVAETAPGFGGAAGLQAAIERNHRDQATMAAILGQDAIEALYRQSLDALAHVAPLLDRRRAAGKVRRCHGDLRLANICLLDGRATLFDAIEFSDELGCVDVLFDLAFLLMDLEHRDLRLLANRLVNRYLDQTGEDDGLACLPLMISLRAATRAYTLAGSVRRQASAERAQQRAAAAHAHMAMAAALLTPSACRVVALGGPGGSGKSALAHALASGLDPAPGGRLLQSEAMRKRLLGQPLGARLTAAAYDSSTDDRVYAALADGATAAVAAGYSAVVEGGFEQPRHRALVAAAARMSSVPFVSLWLGPPQDIAADAGAVAWHVVGDGGDPVTFAKASALVRDIAPPGRSGSR